MYNNLADHFISYIYEKCKEVQQTIAVSTGLNSTWLQTYGQVIKLHQVYLNVIGYTIGCITLRTLFNTESKAENIYICCDLDIVKL